MASITLFLLFVVLLVSGVRAQNNHSINITLGSTLSPKTNSTSWMSASGLFAFGFYPQGNGFAIGIWLIGKPENTIVWTAKRDNPPLSSDSVLELTKQGWLLLQSEKEKERIANVSEPAASASMLDSGNFVLYSENYTVIWQSFDLPTDTILGGQILSYGQELVSALSKSDPSSGHFILSMQKNGNLVAYPVNTGTDIMGAYWGTNTYEQALTGLSLNLTGFLCVRNYEDICLWYPPSNSTYFGRNTTLVYRATLDVDGIFRLYAHQFEKNTSSTVRTMWSALSNQCDVKGICGFNSYCSASSGNAECHCYPGFVSLNGTRNMFLDCEQITKGDCETSADPRMLYNVTSLRGMQLSPSPYLVEQLKVEVCEKSCQEDCNCVAASYTNGTCRKYNLPLLFGRRIQDASATALFKLPSANQAITFSRKPKIFDDKMKNLILTLVLTLGLISFLCLAFAMSIFVIYRRQVYSYKKLSVSANLEFTGDCSLRTFFYHELANSTGDFTEEVGRGSFGVVYRGTICGTNRRIAVKKLDRVVDRGEREFHAEITAIARTHHRNLVQLIGFCIDGSKKLLVYEYMSNGSLADFLFKPEMRLSWKQRVKIALDVARGVLYLHEECEVCIVHCNIKPQNILMDEVWTAKISDFGLARLIMREHSRTTTENEVTSSYLAPEWRKDASASVKVDIYSYGVVLLEIICCRRSIDVNVSSEDEIMLSSWVYNCFVRGELNKIVVDEDVEWKTMERMVKVGLWCVQEDLSLRPSMKNVVLMLEGLKDIPIPPSPAPLV